MRLLGLVPLGLLVLTSFAQAPTGPSPGPSPMNPGAAVPAASVTITNKETGLKRATVTAIEGTYSAPSLPAGARQVRRVGQPRASRPRPRGGLLHRVLIDVVGNRLAYAVADLDCARVVHATPDPAIVTVRACLRDAGVHAARLTGGRQCKSLF